MPQPNAFIPYEVPVPNRRPTSVLVLGILGIVLSSLVLIAAAFSLAMMVAVAGFRQVAAANTGGTRADLVWYAVQLIASWMFYSVLLWASIAAIRLRPWAHPAMLRWAGVYLSWLGVEAVVVSAWVIPRAVAAARATVPTASAAFQERMGYVMMTVSVIVSALFPIFVLIFMRKPHVRAAFEGTLGAPWPLAGLMAEYPPGATPAPPAVATEVSSTLPPVAGKADL